MLNELRLLGIVESVEISKSEVGTLTSIHLRVQEQKGVKTFGKAKVFHITFNEEVSRYIENDNIGYGNVLLVKGKLSFNENEELIIKGSSYVVVNNNNETEDEEEIARIFK